MKFSDFVVLIALFALLVIGMYVLWLNFPQEQTAFENYVANVSADLPHQSQQFHTNMRYPDRKISYFISQNCSQKKTNDFLEAIHLIESKTILSFYESNHPEILVTCSNVAPDADEKGHFVAGEGGPSVILNGTRFAVITLGKVALYRPETCGTPQVATHELLHALGFDHNSNEKSIMYPVTSCDQEIDQSIIDEIRELYSVPSAADLVIERVNATKTGRYMNFEIVIANYGLKGVDDSKLEVLVDGSVVKEFDTQNIEIGTRRSLSVTNLKVPSDTRKVTLVVETNEPEISRDNNRADIRVAETN